MKKKLMNVRLVIESTSNTERYIEGDLVALLSDLKRFNLLSGYWHDLQREYEYECEECHHWHGQATAIGKCSVCGKEVCEWCDFKRENEKSICESCADMKDAGAEVVAELNDWDAKEDYNTLIQS